jgi:hypothetical protein
VSVGNSGNNLFEKPKPVKCDQGAFRAMRKNTEIKF